MAAATSEIQVGLLVFPNLTQLDLTGPFETLARVPGARVHLVGRTAEPVRSDSGLVLTPTVGYADCVPLDVLCVPGGPGVNDAMVDQETLTFLRGYRATTHWASIHFLAPSAPFRCASGSASTAIA